MYQTCQIQHITKIYIRDYTTAGIKDKKDDVNFDNKKEEGEVAGKLL